VALRIVSGICLPAFLMSIFVQYNDPDGWVWMIIYALPAALALMGIFGRVSAAAIPASAIYLLGALLLMPWNHLADIPAYVSAWHMSNIHSEHAREAIGLLICMAYFDFLTVVWFLRRRNKTQGV
jgi:hypothetical protein